MNLHINDFQQGYIEYMQLCWASSNKRGAKMPANTCKIIIRNADQSTINKGVSCTSDVELHIFMLTCPR